jgi:hypothetical protein
MERQTSTDAGSMLDSWRGEPVVRVESTSETSHVSPDQVLDVLNLTVEYHGRAVARVAFAQCFPGLEKAFDDRFRQEPRHKTDFS